MSANPLILRMALPVPLHQHFDYLMPDDCDPAQLSPGMRFSVPFGRSRKTGILVATSHETSVAPNRLRKATALLDDQPCFDTAVLEVLTWAAEYYHHPLGEVFNAALPKKLRDGAPMRATETRWSARAPSTATDQLKRAPRQAELLSELQQNPQGLNSDELDALAFDAKRALRALDDRGWIERTECLVEQTAVTLTADTANDDKPQLNTEQQAAVDSLISNNEFCCTLLDGVTGSGKTEVYFRQIEHVLARDLQVMILVPEISLTPQLLNRFTQRFNTPIVVLHSALGDVERLNHWRALRDGHAGIVIGTRSAVFAPLARPGLIVIDEEHDASLKQQEGFRYSARDLAVIRARKHNIPVVLGSATPSFESLHNVGQKRYQLLQLNQRAGDAKPPAVRLMDLRVEPTHQGLATATMALAKEHLENGGQVLFFLNRRGYAPTWYCTGCGWMADCPDCDAHLTYHQNSHSLRCHHCSRLQTVPEECPVCENELKPVGQGTERIEEYLAKQFPGYPTGRMDRDVVRSKPQLEAFLDQVNSGAVKVLIGTQMLAKGHHFPNVTLVVIVHADQGLFGVDFRSTERLAQTMIQVAGRAGRASKPGTVLVQTAFPEHPLLQALLHGGYRSFATAAFEERKQTAWPPFSYLALLRAHSPKRDKTMSFLHAARRQMMPAAKKLSVEVLGPALAPMARRGGKEHGQLLCQSSDRAALHQLLRTLRHHLATAPPVKGVRWSLDVDPIELV